MSNELIDDGSPGGSPAPVTGAAEPFERPLADSAGSGPGVSPATASVVRDGGPQAGGDEDEGGIAAAVVGFVRAAVAAAGRAGSTSVSSIGGALEAPGRALAGRITAGAVREPRPVAERPDLVAALEEQPRSPLLGGATGTAVVARVARRVGPLRFLAKRTPMWLVITAAPAVHASVSRGADELAIVASHLVHRARAAGVEPDPERVRRVAVQLLTRATVDPETEPNHAPLAAAWLQRALRATLPFSPGVATRDPGLLARATVAVDAALLGGAPSEGRRDPA